VALASEYGRYGYRRITALLRDRGWHVGKDRVQRIWRREGLKVPQKQRPRGGLWLGDRSCHRLRPERANHVCSYDFVSAMTHDGRGLCMPTLIDNYMRECLAIEVGQGIGGGKLVGVLGQIAMERGTPKTIRVDNGPEFVSKVLDQWAYRNGVTLDFSRRGKPTDNAYEESFNGSLRDECVNVNWFLSLEDARSKIEAWRGTTMRLVLTPRWKTCRAANPPARAGLAPPLLVLQDPEFSLPSWT
jgi:putative transposase